jgi:biopolymer transport protein ExbD
MRRERFDRINIVPFVDIVLVLLVIVLATATFVRQGQQPMELPESNATAIALKKPMVIAIDANGTYALAGRPLPWKHLQERISHMKSDTPLLLHTDKRAPFGSFARLIASIKSQGITKISIATQPTR